jgi:flagellar basal-body rod protein FlgG
MLNEIMKTASDNGMMQFEVLDRVATNVANVNTTGYKVRRFETYLTPDNRLEGVQRVDNAQGSIWVTKRELDVAIKGDGFIPVTQPDGTVAYTRDGSLAKNSEGMLVTQYGDIVGDGIQIPVNYENVRILPNGEVEVKVRGEQVPKKLGQIPLVTFNNPEGLKSIGYNKLVITDDSGAPQKVDGVSQFKQGNLERSNVSVHLQVDQILRLNAGIISNMRIIKFSDDLYRQAVNLKQ